MYVFNETIYYFKNYGTVFTFVCMFMFCYQQAQITDVSSQNKDFRFPPSVFITIRNVHYENKTSEPECIYGGFTVAYESRSILKGMQLYKPVKNPYEISGNIRIYYIFGL